MSVDQLILCDGLVKIYKVANLEVVALQGLDLAIKRGEMVGIVGASGSGKTTLMNILGGLDRPSAGQIWVNGRNLLALSDTELDAYRRFNVGFVWQQVARNLVPYLSAFENVRLPMILAGSYSKKQINRVDYLLDIVGLLDRKRHRLVELSGGEQQRVAIAVALANNPELVLADEPTGEVDSNTAKSIYQVFKELNTQLSLTILVVSHDPGIAKYMDRVIAIRDGKTSSETTRQIVRSNPLSNECMDAKLPDEVYEEFVLLDSAGRLQVPKEYLEKYQISGRVYLEPITEGILIRSTGQGIKTADKLDGKSIISNYPETRKRNKLLAWLTKHKQ